MDGNIGEFGIYDVILGTAETEILMKELCRKWGITTQASSLL